MAEYINRAKLEFDFEQCNGRNSKWTPQRVSQMIQRQSAEDVAPVVHGRWVIVDDCVMIGDGKHMECSECHTWKKDRIKTDYCPNCGARMDLEVGT